MIDKQTNILKKIVHLKNTISDYAKKYNVGDHKKKFPDELQYDFDHIITIEENIVKYNGSITDTQMRICNKIYRKYSSWSLRYFKEVERRMDTEWVRRINTNYDK